MAEDNCNFIILLPFAIVTLRTSVPLKSASTRRGQRDKSTVPVKDFKLRASTVVRLLHKPTESCCKFEVTFSATSSPTLIVFSLFDAMAIPALEAASTVSVDKSPIFSNSSAAMIYTLVLVPPAPAIVTSSPDNTLSGLACVAP